MMSLELGCDSHSVIYTWGDLWLFSLAGRHNSEIMYMYFGIYG